MLGKRCHCKVRETQAFYLFIKHKKIYYAYFPNLKLTRSTGMSDVRNILDGLEKTDKITYTDLMITLKGSVTLIGVFPTSTSQGRLHGLP